MLGVALGAMILGCLLLILILQRYEFTTKATAIFSPSNSALAANLEKSDSLTTVRL